MKIDFDNVPDAQDYSPLPDGDYNVFIASIEEGMTKAGDDMWNMKLQVFDNDKFAGRYLFDNLVFSEKGLKRVKLILKRGGIDVSKSVNVTPELLMTNNNGLPLAFVVGVTTESYIDREDNEKMKNNIGYAAYEKFEGDLPNSAALVSAKSESDDVPF